MYQADQLQKSRLMDILCYPEEPSELYHDLPLIWDISELLTEIAGRQGDNRKAMEEHRNVFMGAFDNFAHETNLPTRGGQDFIKVCEGRTKALYELAQAIHDLHSDVELASHATDQNLVMWADGDKRPNSNHKPTSKGPMGLSHSTWCHKD